MTKSRTFDIQCDVKASWKGSKEFFGKGSSWFYRQRKVSTLYKHTCVSLPSTVHHKLCDVQLVDKLRELGHSHLNMLCYETTSGGSTAMHEATSGGSTAMHERTSGETIAA